MQTLNGTLTYSAENCLSLELYNWFQITTDFENKFLQTSYQSVELK